MSYLAPLGLSPEQIRDYLETDEKRPAICPEACADGWHAVGCPNGAQFSLGMGGGMLDNYIATEKLAARSEAMDALTAPQLGPLTRAEALEQQRALFAELSEIWNDLFRQQGEASKELRACGARLEVLERQEHGRAVPDYGPDGGAR